MVGNSGRIPVFGFKLDEFGFQLICQYLEVSSKKCFYLGRNQIKLGKKVSHDSLEFFECLVVLIMQDLSLENVP